jgi:hypothetical protein
LADTSTDVLFARIASERNLVLEMIAELDAVKPIRETRRELQIAPRLQLRFD